MDTNHHLYSQDFGTGQPLVILHGFLGCSDNWRPQAKRLSSLFKVHLVDLRNHGKSFHSPVFDFNAMVDDLARWIRWKKLSTIFLIGHSLGGKVAMGLATCFPDLVSKLIVVDIAPKTYPEQDKKNFKVIIDAMTSLDLDTYNQLGAVDRALAAQIPNQGLRQFLLKNLGRKDGGFCWKIGLREIADTYPNILKCPDLPQTFVKPTLFLRGGKSNYVNDSDTPRILAHFPNAEVTTIEGAGHWVHAEKKDEFLDVVSSFLAQHSEGRES